MSQKLTIKFLSLVSLLLLSANIKAQVIPTDSIAADTLKGEKTITTIDSASVKNQSDLTSPIKYSAKDSMMFSVKKRMIYAYGEAKLGMEDMNLDAGHIIMNIDSNYVFAKPIKNKDGQQEGIPVFKQGDETYNIDSLKYNIKTHKGIVYDAVTNQGGGYLHAKITKMQPNKEIHMADGKFTTCDAAHPHFYLHLTKAKVVPDKKIISGPFYFVISDIPLPVGLPFGWFPIRKNKTSGFILPTFTEEKRRGFGLERGGYYFPVSDYMDMILQAEIWTSGSWGFDLTSNYRKRYKFSGNTNISYKKLVEPDVGSSQQFWVRAGYSQDAKANPTSTYNVSLNFGSTKYRQFDNTLDLNNRANNNTSSSIAYTKTFPNFSFSANMSANQNLSTHSLSLQIPTFTLNMTKKLKPFQRKGAVGKKSWYEETQIGFSSSLSNTLNIADTLLFTKEALKKMQNGYNYNIPISTSIKIFKYLNLSPSFNYKGRIYSQYFEQNYHDDVINGEDTLFYAGYRTDTIRGFAHVYDFSFSAPLSTKLYGMFQFKRGKIAAIRHVMSPSISFGFTPDFGNEKWGFYTRDRLDTTGRKLFAKYDGIYNRPPTGRNGSIGFSLGNNLEMKVHSKDTTEKFKKIVLLQGLNFSTSYNLAVDSFRWAPLSISANTSLFKQVSVSYGSSMDLYITDVNGNRRDTLYLQKYHKLGRFVNHNISLSGSISSETFKKKKKENSDQESDQNALGQDPGTPDFEDTNRQRPGSGKNDNKNTTDDEGYSFSIPWSTSINLTYSRANAFKPETKRFETINTALLSLSGNLSLTSKWKINGSANFDLKEGKLVNTYWSLYRDLHCWEMSFNFTPFGAWKSYSFRINVKSSMFQGLEYKKQQSYRDNFAF